MAKSTHGVSQGETNHQTHPSNPSNKSATTSKFPFSDAIPSGEVNIYPSVHFGYAVNAKELHAFLYPVAAQQATSHQEEEEQEAFQLWIHERIQSFGFEVNFDFALQDEVLIDDDAPLDASQFCLSLNMAKELARIERTERGRQARYYLLEFEYQRHGRMTAQENKELFLQKVKQLNEIAQSIKVSEEVAIIPAVDLVRLIKAIRQYQKMAHYYASPEYEINPSWINELIESLKEHTGKEFMDEPW